MSRCLTDPQLMALTDLWLSMRKDIQPYCNPNHLARSERTSVLICTYLLQVTTPIPDSYPCQARQVRYLVSHTNRSRLARFVTQQRSMHDSDSMDIVRRISTNPPVYRSSDRYKEHQWLSKCGVNRVPYT